MSWSPRFLFSYGHPNSCRWFLLWGPHLEYKVLSHFPQGKSELLWGLSSVWGDSGPIQDSRKGLTRTWAEESQAMLLPGYCFWWVLDLIQLPSDVLESSLLRKFLPAKWPLRLLSYCGLEDSGTHRLLVLSQCGGPVWSDIDWRGQL